MTDTSPQAEAARLAKEAADEAARRAAEAAAALQRAAAARVGIQNK
ncbi:hypothetical protein ABZV75_38470 [Streptomyces flaveolus]